MIDKSVSGVWTHSNGEHIAQIRVHTDEHACTTFMQHDSGMMMWHRLNAAKVLIAGSGGLVAEVHTPGSPFWHRSIKSAVAPWCSIQLTLSHHPSIASEQLSGMCRSQRMWCWQALGWWPSWMIRLSAARKAPASCCPWTPPLTRRRSCHKHAANLLKACCHFTFLALRWKPCGTILP